MSWDFQPAALSFEPVRKDWDALNQQAGGHILLDAGFVAPLLRHFGGPHVLLGASKNSSESGLGLFIRKGHGLWETFQPAQAPIGLILLSRADRTGEALSRITHSLPGYALQLSVLQQDPDHSCFAFRPREHSLECLDYIQTARITLQGTFEDYWKARGSNLRHNLARRRRRLIEKGYASELIEIRSPAKVAAAIREYGLLESQGWKGRDGTAIAEGNVQGRFYREIFEHFCERGEAVIFQFLVNGQVAASDLCLLRNGMMVVLKTAYDEQFNDFSPAFLMREEILQRTFAEGRVNTIEFYGRVMEWHTRWSKEIRTLFHINFFRNRWVAPLKRLAGRFA